MGLIFFVSHSYADERLAGELVEFLISAVGVEKTQIRCTSHLPAGLATGAPISKRLRKDIKDCEYFVSLITPNSSNSEFVAFEIGAAWVLKKKHIIPLVFMPVGPRTLPRLLQDFVCRDISKFNELVRLAHDLNSEIFVRKDQRSAPEIVGAAERFLSRVSDDAPAPSSSNSGFRGRRQARTSNVGRVERRTGDDAG
jgi:hypothetical protein